jgi:assimilatory nitrate reductase catalytic subunit
MFGINPTAEHVAYHDKAEGQQRFAFFNNDKLVAAVFLSRQPVAVSRSMAVSFLSSLFENRQSRFSVIATRAAANRPDPGALICACFSVGANQIAAAIQKGCATVTAIGEATSAGTNCGSCKSEIHQLILRSLHGEQLAAE